jgi:hypothetical protein
VPSDPVDFSVFLTAMEEIAKMALEFNEAVEAKDYNKVGQMFCFFLEVSKTLRGVEE